MLIWSGWNHCWPALWVTWGPQADNYTISEKVICLTIPRWQVGRCRLQV